MPFRLINAPATFQAYINKALKGLLDDIYITFIDNILIFNKNPKEYTHHMRLVLERLKQHRLFIKLSKYEFSTLEVNFLDYRVRVTGVLMNTYKVQVIRD